MTMGHSAVLIDLSGTLHVEDEVIPGSIEALEKLKASNVKTCFVTNTTKESKRSLVERLNSLGFSINPNELFTSLTAAYRLVKERQLRPYLVIDDKALDDFTDIDTNDPNAVVIGLAPEKFTFETMTNAFRLILRNAPLIAIHKGRYYKKRDGLNLGPGPYVTALEYATGVKAEVVGKPEATFFESSLKALECSPSQAVMIGDDVKDDIDGAQKIGIKGILVQTGKYRPGDENLICPPPYRLCGNFAEAVDHVLQIIK